MNRNAYTWKMLTLIGRRHVLSVGGSIQKIFPPTSNRILLKVCISILDRIHDKEGRSSLSTKGRSMEDAVTGCSLFVTCLLKWRRLKLV
ncbi:uncharacterized protein LOC132635520 isoform X2 [Lycium barbarum]|uniref:uncharacterized protein LOC132635520 isoform X2 n=1 Tax=Lycium barbarum TaxID=112863 RepID=UPI00293E24CE|nr:uncharacterized protein LOC132635520 isoform X2 [Lycium barbarum]